MGKRKSQERHARRRASERLGLNLNSEHYSAIISRIQRNTDVEFVGRQSNRVTLWRVHFNEKEFIAVYDKHRKSLVTVLLPEWLGAYNSLLSGD